MVLQVLLYHFVSHLPYRRTKIPSRPHVPTPIALLDMRELFKQLSRCSSFNSPHDLTWGHFRRSTYQYMYMVFAHHPFHDLDFKRIACLLHQLFHTQSDFTNQYLVSVFRHPYKVVLDAKNRMASISIFDRFRVHR